MKGFKHMLLWNALILTAIGVRAGNGVANTKDSSSFFGSGNGPAARVVLHGSLVSFNAASGKNSFTLSWNAAAQLNCAHYVVERSLDGATYEELGEVPASAGVQAYSFQDNFRPTTARKYDFYYRLKLVDANGQGSYSKTLIARVYNSKSLAALSITPDPSTNDIMVNAQLKENSYVVMKITDANGNEVSRKSEKSDNGLNTYQLNGSSQLKPGVYMLEVIVNSKDRMNLQLQKS